MASDKQLLQIFLRFADRGSYAALAFTILLVDIRLGRLYFDSLIGDAPVGIYTNHGLLCQIFCHSADRGRYASVLNMSLPC